MCLATHLLLGLCSASAREVHYDVVAVLFRISGRLVSPEDLAYFDVWLGILQIAIKDT